MKLIGFAIASIVDSNTGNGLLKPHGGNGQLHASHQLDRDTHLEVSSDRSPSRASALIRSASGFAATIIEWFRTQAALRRQIRQLAELSDHQLSDIGLHRGEVEALTLGRISIDDLHRERGERIRSGYRQAARLEVKSLNLPRQAANEAGDAQTRCA